MTSLFPETLYSPRLTLTQFSPEFPSDSHYSTIILPYVSTVNEFIDFCVERAPTPWASHAVVYLLRLRRHDSDDDADPERVQSRLRSEQAHELDDEVIGHVSLAHSLHDRQPRVVSDTSFASDEASDIKTKNFASVALQTSTIPDIGWRILPVHRRHGYASEAAKRLVQFLCVDMDGPRFKTLCCFAGETNAGSRGVARKVGFVDVAVDFGSGTRRGEGEQDEGGIRLGEGCQGDQGGCAGEGVNDNDICETNSESFEITKGKQCVSRLAEEESDIQSTHNNTCKVLTCPSVAKGIWFGILGDGWTWREGRPRQTALEKSVAGLFEAMALGSGVSIQQRRAAHVYDNESASK